MKKILVFFAAALILSAGFAFAEEGGVEIGLDYRFRVDSLKGTVHDYIRCWYVWCSRRTGTRL